MLYKRFASFRKKFAFFRSKFAFFLISSSFSRMINHHLFQE